jgi:hypothetical protein
VYSFPESEIHSVIKFISTLGYKSTAPFRGLNIINVFKINVMDLNTKQRKVLFVVNEPETIAVDPSKGLIFWTAWNGKPIERASMDGNDRMV